MLSRRHEARSQYEPRGMIIITILWRSWRYKRSSRYWIKTHDIVKKIILILVKKTTTQYCVFVPNSADK